MTSIESNLQAAERKLHDARVYRRTWAAVTAGCAAVTAAFIKLAPEVPHHPYELQGSLGFVAVAAVGLTVASFTMILDGTTLVRDRKDELEFAERNPMPDLASDLESDYFDEDDA